MTAATSTLGDMFSYSRVGNMPVSDGELAQNVARSALADIVGHQSFTPTTQGQWAGQNLSTMVTPMAQVPGIASPYINVSGQMFVLKTLFRANEVYSAILGSGGLAPLNYTDKQAIVTRTIRWDKGLPDTRPHRGRVSYGTVRSFMSTSSMTSVGLGLEFTYQFLLGPEGPLYLRMAIESMNAQMTDLFLLMGYDSVLTADDWGGKLWDRTIESLSMRQSGITMDQYYEKENFLFAAVQKLINPLEVLTQYVEDKSLADSEMKHDSLLMHHTIASFVRMHVPEYIALFRAGPAGPAQLKADPQVALASHLPGYSLNVIKPFVADDDGDSRFFETYYPYGEFYTFDSVVPPSQDPEGKYYVSAIQIYNMTSDDWYTVTLDQALENSGRWSGPDSFPSVPAGNGYDIFKTGTRNDGTGVAAATMGDIADKPGVTVGLPAQRVVDIRNAVAARNIPARPAQAQPWEPDTSFEPAPASARIESELIGKWHVPDDAKLPVRLVGANTALMVKKNLIGRDADVLAPNRSTSGARAVMAIHLNSAATTPEQAAGRDALYTELLAIDRSGTPEQINARFERFTKAMVDAKALPSNYTGTQFNFASAAQINAAVKTFKTTPDAIGVFAASPVKIGLGQAQKQTIIDGAGTEAEAFMRIPLSLRALKEFVANKIPLPFRVILMRPNIMFETYSMTACLRGAQGVWFKMPLMSWAPDGHSQYIRATLSVDVTTHVSQPKTIFRLNHVFINRIVSGWGVTWHKGVDPDGVVIGGGGDLMVLIEPLDSPLNRETPRVTAYGSFDDLFRTRNVSVNKAEGGDCFLCRDWVRQHYGITLDPDDISGGELGIRRNNARTDMVCYRGGYQWWNATKGGWEFVPPNGPLAAAAQAGTGRDWYGPGMKTAFINHVMPSSRTARAVHAY